MTKENEQNFQLTYKCPTGIYKGMYTGIYTGKYKYLVNTRVLLIKFAMLIIDHHKRYP